MVMSILKAKGFRAGLTDIYRGNADIAIMIEILEQDRPKQISYY